MTNLKPGSHCYTLQGGESLEITTCANSSCRVTQLPPAGLPTAGPEWLVKRGERICIINVASGTIEIATKAQVRNGKFYADHVAYQADRSAIH
jgi:hypothetical protein